MNLIGLVGREDYPSRCCFPSIERVGPIINARARRSARRAQISEIGLYPLFLSSVFSQADWKEGRQ